jgi:hypothetical protein
LEELRGDAVFPPGLLRGALPRLEAFLQPFVAALRSAEQRTNARHYVQGLLSELPSKDTESIAYLHDRDRQGLQKFIGQADWEHRPLLAELTRQVGAELGEPDAVLVFDPSAFAKKEHRVGRRGAAVVRSPGQGRELSGRRLPRLRLGQGARPGAGAGPGAAVGGGPDPGSLPRAPGGRDVEARLRTPFTKSAGEPLFDCRLQPPNACSTWPPDSMDVTERTALPASPFWL